MTIHERLSPIKRIAARLNAGDAFTILLILVVGFGSFGLGRLSKLQESKSSISVEQTPSTQAASALSSSPSIGASPGGGSVERGGTGGGESVVKDQGLKIKDSALAPGGQLVASKNGTKYHFPWCSGAQRISEANKIWFSSVEEARKAGYTPASNCKGLK